MQQETGLHAVLVRISKLGVKLHCSGVLTVYDSSTERVLSNFLQMVFCTVKTFSTITLQYS